MPRGPNLHGHLAQLDGVADRKVLVIGESLVDILTDGDGGTTEAPGGSPLNIATGLGRLGNCATLLTAIGNDDRASLLRQHLENSHVLLRNGVGLLTCLTTSTATAKLGLHGIAQYDLKVTWPAVTAPSLDGYALVHSGSLASVLRPGAAVVAEMLRSARARAIVTLDPNIRADALPQGMCLRTHYESLFELAHVVKLSDEDAHALYPGWEAEVVLDHLLTLGPALVALTLGSDGSILATPRARTHVPEVEVAVADTVGAGDAYMSGLVHGLLQSNVTARQLGGLVEAELDCLGSVAAVVASLTVTRRGADPPWLDEVRQVLALQGFALAPTGA